MIKFLGLLVVLSCVLAACNSVENITGALNKDLKEIYNMTYPPKKVDHPLQAVDDTLLTVHQEMERGLNLVNYVFLGIALLVIVACLAVFVISIKGNWRKY